jgi:hypothetical protein
MTTVKRINDLTDYTSVLPYASEMFGVYQPLLGWKSKRIGQRLREGYKHDKRQLLETLKRKFAPLVDITFGDNQQLQLRVNPGVLVGGKQRRYDSVVLQKLSELLPSLDKLQPSVWQSVITADRLENLLEKDVVEVYTRAYGDLLAGTIGTLTRAATTDPQDPAARRNAQLAAFAQQLQYESSVAGSLLHLVRENAFPVLEEMFYAKRDSIEEVQQLIAKTLADDGAEAFLSLETLNPRDREHIRSVALSPIAVVHLFRQYFFELDTFLGTPISHVWLSPGSSVELIEVHTRRTIVEKTLEQSLETITQSETTATQQDEISEAVKQENQQDVKFGASVQASYASIEATSSFDMTNSQQMAREVTHKQMRQKTEKLSSEIRKNFKSTFRTVTETTDSMSIKHTMANTTQELINYELRRKMRQVGVQVQDIGTFLCWQTYVDDPGRDLGVAKLIHIARPADLDGIPHPEEIPAMQTFQEEKMLTIPFISVAGGADNEGEVYINGVESNDEEWFGELEKIQADFEQKFVCPKANHMLTHVEFDPLGRPVSASHRGTLPSDGTFTLHLDSADFQGQNSIQVKLILHWAPKPGANDAIAAKNAENLAAFKEAERAAYQKAYVETVKERVTIASKIRTRNNDELREEERIVVYRKLIQDMLLSGVDLPDDRTRHVTAELLNSIFDIDKMLYFVAPEWWRPRLHRSRQHLQETTRPPSVDVGGAANAGTSVMQKGLVKRVLTSTNNVNPGVMSANTVGWGGVNDVERDNYFITEDSEPAKLGSSLGWLLQLDGDNMRNAFLNAPWVKAVIPIRPGREQAAINWLKGVEGMNGITDDVIYHASNPDEKDVDGNPLEGQPLIDVLMDLAEKVRRKYREGIETGKYPKQDEVSDPALVDEENTVTATPIDRVYEHGFFPLEGSFRYNVGKNYEIFDQWIEILPTDQIVPVEVTYDPKTGRQL